jgi:hypothetical protein
MKKLVVTTLIFLGTFAPSKAIDIGFNIGISGAVNVYEAGNAKEHHPGLTKNSADENEDAQGLFGVAAPFAEITLNDKFLVGFDYVPYSLETESISNEQEGKVTGTNVTNVAKVEIEEMMSLYAAFYVTENFYAKAGIMTANANTKEVLATGGSYPDADLEGGFIGFGYERALPANSFIRIEGNYTEIDDVSVTNSADNTKKITISDIDGYGAKLSIGKSF